MKVNEIISEERTDEFIGALAKGAAALFRGAKTGVQALPSIRPIAKAGEIVIVEKSISRLLHQFDI